MNKTLIREKKKTQLSLFCSTESLPLLPIAECLFVSSAFWCVWVFVFFIARNTFLKAYRKELKVILEDFIVNSNEIITITIEIFRKFVGKVV